MLEQRHVIQFLLKEGIRPKGIPERLLNVYHEAAMKKSQVFFRLGKCEEGEKIFPMKRGPGDHPPPVSMQFSHITSCEPLLRRSNKSSILKGEFPAQLAILSISIT
jgi:hypothetical protein